MLIKQRYPCPWQRGVEWDNLLRSIPAPNILWHCAQLGCDHLHRWIISKHCDSVTCTSVFLPWNFSHHCCTSCLILWPYGPYWVSQNPEVQNIQTISWCSISVEQKNKTNKQKKVMCFHLTFKNQDTCISTLILKQRAAGFRKWRKASGKASPVWLAAIQQVLSQKRIFFYKKLPERKKAILRQN